MEGFKGNVITLRSNLLSPPPPPLLVHSHSHSRSYVYSRMHVHSRLGLFGLDKLKNVDRTVSLLSDALDETHK